MFGNRRLTKHIIATVKVVDLDLCELRCYLEPNCVSVNLNVIPDSKGLHECELNNATHRSHDKELMNRDGYIYKGAEVRNVNLFSKKTKNKKKTKTKIITKTKENKKTFESGFISFFGRFMHSFGYEFMFGSDSCWC